jgi:hypothetical protein
MLIKNAYEKDDVVTFKLVTGEEIIAKVLEEKTDVFVISKPLALAMGAQGVGLVPAAFSAELNSLELQRAHVILHAPTRREIINNYIEGTTGIQTVKKSGIIT